MQNLKPYKGVEITFRQGYVHITHPENFVVLPADLDTLWMNVANACRIYDCNRVLNEGRVDFSHLRVFDSYNAGYQAGEIRGLRMACLFYDHTPDEKTEFFITVASNRGAIIKYFNDRAEALKWLGVEEDE
jgi:hypothetical protein